MKAKRPTTPEERRARIQRMKSSRTAPQALLRAMGACCPEKFAGLTANEAWEKADGYNLSWFLKRVVPPGEDYNDETEKAKTKELVEVTGLPKMAIDGIRRDLPDEDLLSNAPFPSCVVIFSRVD